MFLSICWLDDDHKKEINGLLDECIDDFKMNKKEQQWFRTIRSEVNREISGHTTQAISPGRKKRLMLQFVRHQMALDKVRGTDTLAIEPKLTRYFDRCKNDFQSDVLQFDVDGVVNGPA
jgi:ribosomal protein S17E